MIVYTEQKDISLFLYKCILGVFEIKDYKFWIFCNDKKVSDYNLEDLLLKRISLDYENGFKPVSVVFNVGTLEKPIYIPYIKIKDITYLACENNNTVKKKSIFDSVSIVLCKNNIPNEQLNRKKLIITISFLLPFFIIFLFLFIFSFLY